MVTIEPTQHENTPNPEQNEAKNNPKRKSVWKRIFIILGVLVVGYCVILLLANGVPVYTQPSNPPISLHYRNSFFNPGFKVSNLTDNRIVINLIRFDTHKSYDYSIAPNDYCSVSLPKLPYSPISGSIEVEGYPKTLHFEISPNDNDAWSIHFGSHWE